MKSLVATLTLLLLPVMRSPPPVSAVLPETVVLVRVALLSLR